MTDSTDPTPSPVLPVNILLSDIRSRLIRLEDAITAFASSIEKDRELSDPTETLQQIAEQMERAARTLAACAEDFGEAAPSRATLSQLEERSLRQEQALQRLTAMTEQMMQALLLPLPEQEGR
ncbi:hypothetical protein DFP88_10549 [Pseudoroseicyclus aestuarii]|uniref:Uncharacterized protein n=1 Tax=Pseudoroseicyclus aestuarii TaxID=1795041 RepID=A0A318SST8_9RHOB|nr:hypothetical protein DFP88_10549 [Pseudoroseicyclus aestuarii]